MSEDITKRLEKLEKKFSDMERESINRERNWLRTGITVLGFLAMTLFGIIWAYRVTIFGGNP